MGLEIDFDEKVDLYQQMKSQDFICNTEYYSNQKKRALFLKSVTVKRNVRAAVCIDNLVAMHDDEYVSMLDEGDYPFGRELIGEPIEFFNKDLVIMEPMFLIDRKSDFLVITVGREPVWCKASNLENAYPPEQFFNTNGNRFIRSKTMKYLTVGCKTDMLTPRMLKDIRRLMVPRVSGYLLAHRMGIKDNLTANTVVVKRHFLHQKIVTDWKGRGSEYGRGGLNNCKILTEIGDPEGDFFVKKGMTLVSFDFFHGATVVAVPAAALLLKCFAGPFRSIGKTNILRETMEMESEYGKEQRLMMDRIFYETRINEIIQTTDYPSELAEVYDSESSSEDYEESQRKVFNKGWGMDASRADASVAQFTKLLKKKAEKEEEFYYEEAMSMDKRETNIGDTLYKEACLQAYDESLAQALVMDMDEEDKLAFKGLMKGRISPKRMETLFEGKESFKLSKMFTLARAMSSQGWEMEIRRMFKMDLDIEILKSYIDKIYGIGIKIPDATDQELAKIFGERLKICVETYESDDIPKGIRIWLNCKNQSKYGKLFQSVWTNRECVLNEDFSEWVEIDYYSMPRVDYT
jgi:hypothetical protein